MSPAGTAPTAKGRETMRMRERAHDEEREQKIVRVREGEKESERRSEKACAPERDSAHSALVHHLPFEQFELQIICGRRFQQLL